MARNFLPFRSERKNRSTPENTPQFPKGIPENYLTMLVQTKISGFFGQDTNLIPRAYSPFKMADSHGEKRQVIEALNTSKKHSSVQKVVKVKYFSLLVYHFMALAFHINMPFVFNNLIYFLSEKVFPKKP